MGLDVPALYLAAEVSEHCVPCIPRVAACSCWLDAGPRSPLASWGSCLPRPLATQLPQGLEVVKRVGCQHPRADPLGFLVRLAPLTLN